MAIRIVTVNVGQLREQFLRLKRNAMYCASEAEWMAEVVKLAKALSGGEEPTPEQWVLAAQRATVKCDRCKDGRYYWGAVINGTPSKSGPCFRCGGTGRQGQEDFARNWGYDNNRSVI